MANAQIIEQKAARVKEVQEKIEKAKSVVFFDYRGLTVAEVTELRAAMRKENVEYVVIKNNVAARAAEAAKVDKAVEEMLKGTVAYAFGYEDEVAPPPNHQEVQEVRVQRRYRGRQTHQRTGNRCYRRSALS